MTGLAGHLTTVSAALDRAIRVWRARGATGDTPEEVTLYAIAQQRVYRRISMDRPLAARVIGRLPRSLVGEARDITTALGNLRALAPKGRVRRRRLKTGASEPPARLLGHYSDADRRFGVDRHVLAAVNLVETGFNKLQNDSVAGARGPMQFLPATWRQYGRGGNIRDPRDAILGAANLLRASGAPADNRRALFAYNHSDLYVSAVLRYARRMQRDRNAFYAFHSWQVFVRTPAGGEKRITGP